MASIRKRGENSYLLVVSRGYDYQGNRLKPAQKTVHPPKGLTAKQTEKWLNEQAVLYEREVKHTPGESVDRSITLAKYIDVWLEQVAPKKLAASTLVRANPASAGALQAGRAEQGHFTGFLRCDALGTELEDRRTAG